MSVEHGCWVSRKFQGVFRFKAILGVEGSKWRFTIKSLLGRSSLFGR